MGIYYQLNLNQSRDEEEADYLNSGTNLDDQASYISQDYEQVLRNPNQNMM